MNCAVVTIGSGSAKREVEERAVEPRAAYSSRPQIFLADIGNGCATTEGVDVNYPNPGPDVVNGGSNLGPPVGTCGTASSGSGSGSGSAASSSAVQATATPAAAATTTKLPGYVQATNSPPLFTLRKKANSSPSGVFVTVAPTTTLATSTKKATPTTTAAASSGGKTGSGSGSSSGSGSTASGAMAVGTKCTAEGDWNCIGGTQWQRCASGTWSAIQPVAPGTVCKAGQSANLEVSVASKLRRRFRGAARALF